jgi:hypothetical protein
VRIRTSTGPGASPLSGQHENSNEQTGTRSLWIRALLPGQSVYEWSAGALPLIFAVSITVVTFGGDR